MADLSSFYQTYDNAGSGVAASYLDANKKAISPGNGIAGRTVIVSVLGTDDTNVTQAELDGVIRGITYGETAGSPATTDAFTVVGVSGTVASGTMYLMLNGTGTVETTQGDYHTATTVADNEATTVTRGRLCRGKSILQDSHTTQACHFKREFKRHSKKSYLVPC